MNLERCVGQREINPQGMSGISSKISKFFCDEAKTKKPRFTHKSTSTWRCPSEMFELVL
jgi:hypothetical protein